MTGTDTYMTSMKMRDHAHTDERSFKRALLANPVALAKLDAEAEVEFGPPPLRQSQKRQQFSNHKAYPRRQIGFATCVAAITYQIGWLVGWI